MILVSTEAFQRAFTSSPIESAKPPLPDIEIEQSSAPTKAPMKGVAIERPAIRIPLNRNSVLKSVGKTGRLLIADEDYLGFGLTGEISAIVAENLDSLVLKAPIKRLAVPNVPIPYSRPLEQFVIPQVKSIVEAVQNLMKTRVAEGLAA
jgi:hypothetical protein